MLIIKDLSLYMTRDFRLILKDFNFSLLDGMKAALIGEEGNGKSTLLKAIAEPDSIAEYAEISGEIHKAAEIIGYLPQVLKEEVLSQTTEDYLQSKLQGREFDYSRYYRLLGELDFAEEHISKQVTLRQLSGGEKIKFQLFCELIKEPTVLLLDEPSNDLDLDSVLWLERFVQDCRIPLMFVSHDELLLERCANTIIHLEQLHRKTRPQHTVSGLSYGQYVQDREEGLRKQTRTARKEQEEYEAKMERYRQIYQRVHHELKTVSRQAPSVAKNLKDKMRSVKAMGKRFEREKETMSKRPDFEESILVSFEPRPALPKGKKVLELKLEALRAGQRVLSRNLELTVFGPKKVCIVGQNGSGKTTLLRLIQRELAKSGLSCGYMPQDYGEAMDPQQNAIEFLSKSERKEERTKVRTYLGSMNFTKEEMFRPVRRLSGGQQAKLYFAKLILDQPEVLILDEPTRNLSPLSGPEIRRALRDFGGCIIAVSHDRKFIAEVFEEVLLLESDGLSPVNLQAWDE